MQRKILIVDDQIVNRALLCKILRDDYTVVESGGGEEALAVLRAAPEGFAAVLLDIVMPVVDGYEVLRRIRADKELSPIPVIVATGSADEDAEVRALSCGANDFVTKPYNPVLIRHCLRNAINLRETSSAVRVLQRDRLTGLYNRETFLEKAAALIREKPSGYYVMSCFDMDNFKIVNDLYGTSEGDRILRQMGSVVKADMETMDGLCSRIAADNFAVLYPLKRLEDEGGFISQMQCRQLLPDDARVAVTFSVGRYVITDPTLSVEAIYDRACMAKRSVKGRYGMHIAYFDNAMREALLREQQIVGDMDAALARRQFEVWFQPQFNHASGTLIGSEALVRWRHPQQGLIPPGQFIPVFERNGFIYELDKYVWEQVCRQLRQWLDEGRDPLPVSVNISRYDVFRADLTEVLAGLTQTYGIPVELLRLEITESAFAQSSGPIIATVKRLMAHGFTVEIDDFGSGYSSLNTLKDVPANVLKLDMRFLQSSENSRRGGNILESIVRMAKWLDMAVIAEGVETREQADFLKSIGCSCVQGYLYARPMPAADYAALAAGMDREARMPGLQTVVALDNNAFWDPASMETLIFNSYVGGACVLEFSGGRIELLRANDKYARIVGGAGMAVEDALKLDWARHLDDADRAAVLEAVRRSAETGEEVTGEFRFLDLPGCPRETYLRSTLRVIASVGDRHLVYCNNENITAQRRAEAKERRVSEQMRAVMDGVGSGITASVMRDGVFLFLLANDRYYEILGYTQQQYAEEVRDMAAPIHPDDRPRTLRAAAAAYDATRPVTLEFRIVRRDGGERWVRVILSATTFTGVAEMVQLNVLTDITAEKQAEQALRETDRQLRFLNDMAHALLAQPDSEAGIGDALRRLLEHFDGTRVCVVEFDDRNAVSSNTYEVCAAGVDSRKDRLQKLPFDVIPFWLHAFDGRNHLHVEDVDALEASETEKQRLKEGGVVSLLAVPLRRDGKLLGCLSLENPRRRESQVARLAALGDYMAVMLTRRDLNAKIRRDNATLLGFMNDTPGGFVRMRVAADGNTIPVYYNDGFCALVGMTQEEVMALYGENAMAGVHPDDLDIVRDVADRMLTLGEAHGATYRLRHGDDGYAWVTVSGRRTRNDAGETYLNVYYADASERNRLEEERRELLDNMPCGAALYEFDGETVTAIHLNRRYRELVGRDLPDMPNLSVLDPVHPDDRAALLAEARLAIREQRDMESDLRIRHGQSGYRHFHIVGRIIPRDDGRYAVYASFTPVTGVVASYLRTCCPWPWPP